MASPNETAVLRHVLEMEQASKHRLARAMGISAEYAETFLRGMHRKGWLVFGRAPRGSKCDVYKLTPGGADELLDVLGYLRQKEFEKAEQAALNMKRFDRRTVECKTLMTQQGLISQEAMEGVL